MNGNDDKRTERADAPGSGSTTAVKKFRQPLVAYLLSGLEDDDKWVRIMAAEMLGAAGDPHSAENLKPLLVGGDGELRLAAEKSLAMIRSPRAAYFMSQGDRCETCLIRLIAYEALEKLRAERKGGNRS